MKTSIVRTTTALQGIVKSTVGATYSRVSQNHHRVPQSLYFFSFFALPLPLFFHSMGRAPKLQLQMMEAALSESRDFLPKNELLIAISSEMSCSRPRQCFISPSLVQHHVYAASTFASEQEYLLGGYSFFILPLEVTVNLV